MISTIIVAKGMWPVTKTCLDSLVATIQREIEIIYVDNGTPEGENSVAEASRWAEEHKQVKVRIIDTRIPLCLAAAWNLGIQSAIGDPILVINNDIIFNDSGWWYEFEQALADPTIGVVGLNGMSWATVPFIQGSIFAFTRDTWTRVGEFDPRFEFTTEDVDFCLRAQRLGLKIKSFEHLRSKINHLEGTTRNYYVGERKKYQELAHISRIRFCYKHDLPILITD